MPTLSCSSSNSCGFLTRGRERISLDVGALLIQALVTDYMKLAGDYVAPSKPLMETRPGKPVAAWLSSQ